MNGSHGQVSISWRRENREGLENQLALSLAKTSRPTLFFSLNFFLRFDIIHVECRPIYVHMCVWLYGVTVQLTYLRFGVTPGGFGVPLARIDIPQSIYNPAALLQSFIGPETPPQKENFFPQHEKKAPPRRTVFPEVLGNTQY